MVTCELFIGLLVASQHGTRSYFLNYFLLWQDYFNICNYILFWVFFIINSLGFILLREEPGDGALVTLEQEPDNYKHKVSTCHSQKVSLSYFKLIPFVIQMLKELRNFHGSWSYFNIEYESLSNSLITESQDFLVLFH